MDRVWIESAWRQEDLSLFSLVCLDLVLKVDSVDMLKLTHTHTSLKFKVYWFWFSVLSLTPNSQKWFKIFVICVEFLWHIFSLQSILKNLFL